MGINTLDETQRERENTQTKKITAAHHLGDFVNQYIEDQQSTKINQICYKL